MKKFILITIAFLLSISLLTYKFYNEDSIEEVPTKNIKQSSMLSMMLETEANSGNYEMTTSSSWPTDGYVFNSELSKCEQGSKLSWDDTNKKVMFEGNSVDKCYVYFDVYSPPTIADLCSSGDTLTTCIKTFGNQGSDISNIYIHNSSLENGAGDNSYRFAGSSEIVYNYVCFGSDAKTCPADNLYRIIGVIDGKVKLIKYDYATSALLGTDGDYYGRGTPNASNYKGSLTTINTYYWNYKATNSATNTWSTSLLNKTNLNTNFINNIGSTWASKIATTIWKVGGNTTANIYSVVPSVAYQNEVVNPVTTNTTDNATEYTAKIGLMYVSDYGFAADPSAWTTTLINYDGSVNGSTIKSLNWMYMGYYDWTISRNSVFSDNASFVDRDGYVGGISVYIIYGCRPSFNLESTVTYVSGDGSQNSPIRIN